MTCPHSTHEATWKGPCYSTSKRRPCWSGGILDSMLSPASTSRVMVLTMKVFTEICILVAAVEDIPHGNVSQFKHDVLIGIMFNFYQNFYDVKEVTSQHLLWNTKVNYKLSKVEHRSLVHTFDLRDIIRNGVIC